MPRVKPALRALGSVKPPGVARRCALFKTTCKCSTSFLTHVKTIIAVM